MNNQQTLEKMKNLRLFGMQASFENALETGMIHDFKPDEFIAHLVDAEHEDKCDRKTQRMIKNARFKYIAQIEALKYPAERNLNKSQILKLCDLKWVARNENLIITGATGTGKTYIASAIGLQACVYGYRVECINSSALFHRLKYARTCGNYLKEMKKIIKNDLLIIDDFGLEILDSESRMSLFEILEERTEKKAMIISSQVPPENWYDIIGEKTIADAICDRMISNAQFINLKGESMRKNKTKQP